MTPNPPSSTSNLETNPVSDNRQSSGLGTTRLQTGYAGMNHNNMSSGTVTGSVQLTLPEKCTATQLWTIDKPKESCFSFNFNSSL